jgi:hypothetical protein
MTEHNRKLTRGSKSASFKRVQSNRKNSEEMWGGRVLNTLPDRCAILSGGDQGRHDADLESASQSPTLSAGRQLLAVGRSTSRYKRTNRRFSSHALPCHRDACCLERSLRQSRITPNPAFRSVVSILCYLPELFDDLLFVDMESRRQQLTRSDVFPADLSWTWCFVRTALNQATLSSSVLIVAGAIIVSDPQNCHC